MDMASDPLSPLALIRSSNQCSFCTRNISKSFFVKCAECKDFFLCSDCFAAGVKLYPHENSHAYHIPDCLDNPLFVKDWTVKEDLMLLEGTIIGATIESVVNVIFVFRNRKIRIRKLEDNRRLS